MKLHELKSAPGSTHRNKIVGRGPGSGHGKTSTRGEKGQKARSGASIHPWFEGGQTPLFKRLPRRGFSNKRFETKYATPLTLKEAGLVKKELSGIKILGGGKLEKKLTVKANVFTNTAITKIEELGGTTEVI